MTQRKWLWLLTGLVLAVGASVAAAPLYTHLETATARGMGTKISAAACDADSYTGWIDTSLVDEVVFHVFNDNDADGAININMTCQVSQSNSTANGSGFSVCAKWDDAAGVLHYKCPATYALEAINADNRWKWSVTNIQATYLNCLFDCGSDADDTITVTAYGVTP